jgi:hypothetical protein
MSISVAFQGYGINDLCTKQTYYYGNGHSHLCNDQTNKQKEIQDKTNTTTNISKTTGCHTGYVQNDSL